MFTRKLAIAHAVCRKWNQFVLHDWSMLSLLSTSRVFKLQLVYLARLRRDFFGLLKQAVGLFASRRGRGRR
jgi:hypothetical protein